jgi:hypothetical protein
MKEMSTYTIPMHLLSPMSFKAFAILLSFLVVVEERMAVLVGSSLNLAPWILWTRSAEESSSSTD